MAFSSNLLTVFDFAAGSGMLGEAVRLALDTVGVESVSVGYVEREASAAAAIVAGLEAQGLPRPAIWSDARTFDSQRFRGCVDIFCAGYPCQPFSFAGKRSGESDPRHLWPAVCAAIEAIEPGIVFLENVSGHVTLGFERVWADLHGLGYVVTPGLFSAEEVGARHKRERLFVLAIAAGSQLRSGGAVAGGRSNSDETDPYAELSDTAMAIADCRRREDDTKRDCDALPHSADGDTRRHDDDRRDSELAIANDAGSRTGIEGEQGEQAGNGRHRPEHNGATVPVFPPGPRDLESWAAIARVDPSRMPSIESDVRGMADGLAPWSERVRMLGNGVVPLAAAYAFLSLFACASGE